MATTTQRAKPEAFALLFMCVSSALYTGHAVAQQASQAGLNVSGQVKADLIFQNVDRDNVASTNLTTLSVAPQLNLSYTSTRFFGNVTGTVTRLERSNDNFSQENTYSAYNYLGSLAVIEDLLTLRVNGSLSFQNAFANNFLSNDFINDQGQLLQTRANTVSAILDSQNGDWVRGNSSISYSQTGSDQNEFQNNQSLDADIISATAQLYQGDQVLGVVWNVSGGFSKVERDESATSAATDFETRRVIASLDIGIIGDWAFRINADHEGSSISNLSTRFTAARSFSSYGGGITYSRTSNKSISVTYNTTVSDIDDQDGVGFVGVDVNWAFSARTSITANLTRRFFGDSANVSLNYNTKHFRSSVTYTEDVTTNALSITDIGDFGVFVCPLGVTAIGSCFQPDSLNFVPDASQQFVQFNVQNLEVNSNAILRQTFNALIGYSFSRLNISLFSRVSEETFLDIDDAQRKTTTIGTDLSYQLGAFTSLTSNISYAEINSRGDNSNAAVATIPFGESDNFNASIGVIRELGRNLSASADLSYIDSSGTLNAGIFGNNFTDSRISFSVIYRYD